MEIAIIRLMQKLEIIPENVGNYMEQMTNNRGQEQPALSQPGFNQAPQSFGGIMPGNNPMELLQMQQMAQFQQMQQMQQQMNAKK